MNQDPFRILFVVPLSLRTPKESTRLRAPPALFAPRGHEDRACRGHGGKGCGTAHGAAAGGAPEDLAQRFTVAGETSWLWEAEAGL